MPAPPPRAEPTSTPKAPAASPVQSRGHTNHAAQTGYVGGTRPSTRPIEGTPVRARTGDAPVGPKPARRSSAPPVPDLALPGVPDLDLGLGLGLGMETASAAEPSYGITAAPELDIALPSGPPPQVRASSGGLQALAMTGELFSGFELDGVPEPTPERYQQGSAINTSANTPLLIDVTPLSLGVETVGGYSDVLIPANSPVPCEKTRTFLTASDGQTIVSIRVAQGESKRFAENTRLGDLELSGLRSARRGEVRIAVTFELDADGILNVRARDQDTGRQTTATMRLLGASTDSDEIGAMVARQARHDVA